MSKCIHSDYLNKDTCFLVFKNTDNSYKSVMKGTSFKYDKSWPSGTKFKEIWKHYQNLLLSNGIPLSDKYNQNSIIKALRKLEAKQTKLLFI